MAPVANSENGRTLGGPPVLLWDGRASSRHDRHGVLISPRILAIEDDPSLRALYVDAFEGDGFEVITAANGAEGLDRLESRPDVILLDLMMPVMDGYTFLTALRKHNRARSIPVVVVSAVLPADHIRGAQQVIAKPFDINRLSGILRAYATA